MVRVLGSGVPFYMNSGCESPRVWRAVDVEDPSSRDGRDPRKTETGSPERAMDRGSGWQRVARTEMGRFGKDRQPPPAICHRRHYKVLPGQTIWKSTGESALRVCNANFPYEVCMVVMAEKAQDADFSEAMENWPELKQKLGEGGLGSKERGAVSSMHSLQNVYNGNIALVGDASGASTRLLAKDYVWHFRRPLCWPKA